MLCLRKHTQEGFLPKAESTSNKRFRDIFLLSRPRWLSSAFLRLSHWRWTVRWCSGDNSLHSSSDTLFVHPAAQFPSQFNPLETHFVMQPATVGLSGAAMYRAWDWPVHEEGLDWAETSALNTIQVAFPCQLAQQMWIRSIMSIASNLGMESIRGRLLWWPCWRLAVHMFLHHHVRVFSAGLRQVRFDSVQFQRGDAYETSSWLEYRDQLSNSHVSRSV